MTGNQTLMNNAASKKIYQQISKQIEIGYRDSLDIGGNVKETIQKLLNIIFVQ